MWVAHMSCQWGAQKAQAEGHQGGLPGEGGTKPASKSKQREKALHEPVTASAVGRRRQMERTPFSHQEWAPSSLPSSQAPREPGGPGAMNSLTVAREIRILLKWPDVSELRASSRDL